MMFTASDVLLKAASRIEEEGMWCRGHFFADAPDCGEPLAAFELAVERLGYRTAECAIGALMSSAAELGLPQSVCMEAENRLEVWTLTENAMTVAEFNDSFGRTAHEVAEAMRRAAT